MDETGVKMSTMLDDGASTASIPSPTHWYDDPQRALGAELVEILTRTPFVLVLAYYVGKAFAKARLPRISGYLVTGVVCGSHVLGILGRGATRRTTSSVTSTSCAPSQRAKPSKKSSRASVARASVSIATSQVGSSSAASCARSTAKRT